MQKRGFSTSEAKLSLGTIVGMLAAAVYDKIPPEYAGIGAVVVTVGYSIARGFAKFQGSESPPAPPSVG